MRTINLLPDRPNQSFWLEASLTLVQFGLVMIILACFIGSWWWHGQTRLLADQTTAKKTERAKVKDDINHATDLQTQLSYIISRQASWATLEAKNRHYGHLLSQLAAASPPTFRLTNLNSQDGQVLTISGTAVSRSDITSFTANLERSQGFANVTLSQANSQPEGIVFVLTVNFSDQVSETSPSPSPKGGQP